MATSNKNTKNTKNTTQKTKTFVDYEKEARESIKGDLNESLKINDETAKAKKDSTNTLYKGYISDAEKSYQDEYRDNSVQKLINERAVAENMANMGLTDSGLNRTQQTAVQLSYANNKASIDRQKQAQVDALARELAATLNGIETDRLTNKQSITDSYNQLAKQTATSLYNTDVEAQSAAADRQNEWNMKLLDNETERYKAKLNYNAKVNSSSNSASGNSASDKSGESNNSKESYVIRTSGGLLSKDFKGTLKDNGVDTYKKYDSEGNYKWVYVDNKSGNKIELEPGQNPYTGTFNKDLLDENGDYDETRAWENGYQPKYKDGVKLTDTRATVEINGVELRIWQGKKLRYYYWDARSNEYARLPLETAIEAGLV